MNELLIQYVLGGLSIAVIAEALIIARLFGLVDRLRTIHPDSECCEKAKEAWKGVDELYDWIKVVGFHEWITCVNDAIKNQKDCTPGADPTWPPEDPGDFPA